MGPYAYLRDQWVSFDDIDMIREKSEFIKSMGLGGGMIWALDLDDFKNICGCENYPLLRTINRVLRNYAKPAPKCNLGQPDRNPVKKPIVIPEILESAETEPPGLISVMPCQGRLFVPDDQNCNQYYLCNQGQLQLQACPSGLYWNKDHCDWPENTQCHPDSTTINVPSSTTTEVYVPQEEDNDNEFVLIENPKPSEPGTTIDQPADSGYKVVCYFTNWAWYR